MTDVLIIGGGMAGLLEAETAFGYHASGRSAAQFIEGYGNDTVHALNATSLPALLADASCRWRGLARQARGDARAHDMGGTAHLRAEPDRRMPGVLRLTGQTSSGR